jgi:transposase
MKTEYARAKRKTFHDLRTPMNIKALYAQGLSPQQIATKVCCHVNHVRRILNVAVPIT